MKDLLIRSVLFFAVIALFIAADSSTLSPLTLEIKQCITPPILLNM
ncbi:MAG: hypothetical protein IPH11_12935 [Ignavibacteriales bacterium]|nr:hypothetical protein [Ignavibacteriales bacterium]